VVKPLSESTYKIQFTATRAFRDKLRQAQDLLRHRVPDGDLEEVLGRGLDLLIETVKKERFAVGRKPRESSSPNAEAAATREIHDPIKRAVYERDQGRCTFLDENGDRCAETGFIEFDHIDGYARTREHRADRIRLRCRAHNQHAAEKMYGRSFMERKRGAAIRAGADRKTQLVLAATNAAALPPAGL
jgi:hypothetical protein